MNYKLIGIGSIFIIGGVFFFHKVWQALGTGEITEERTRSSNRSVVGWLLDDGIPKPQSQTYSANKTPIRYWLDLIGNFIIGVILVAFGSVLIYISAA